MPASGEVAALCASSHDISRFDGGQINLSKTPPAEVFTKELRRIQLEGRIAHFVVPDLCNFIECLLININCDEVDFSRCDLKDNTITKSLFIKSKFVGSGFVLNTVAKTKFEKCNFYDTVIQNCEFYEVEFRSCDFTSLVVKDCLFARCTFIDCETSNKLFEMCLLNSCRFENTQLQIQTVRENFGLRSTQVTGPLRSDRTDQAHETLDHDRLETSLIAETHPLARLSLFFFLSGNLIDGSKHLDAALDVRYWIRTQSTIGSFSVILTRFCEFLLQLHENNELAYLPLIRLHAVTGALASMIPADSRLRQAEFAVYGAHLSIARQIEDFGLKLAEFSKSRRRTWTFLVDGKHPVAFYKEELAELFDRGRPRIVSLVPHNSPWEMVLTFPSTATLSAFMALFFATRTRVELLRIRGQPNSVLVNQRKRSNRRTRDQLAHLTLGAARGTDAKSLFHFSTHVSPTLSVDFQLSVSTRCIGKIRRVVLTWLK